jgi:hypothetical protein
MVEIAFETEFDGAQEEEGRSSLKSASGEPACPHRMSRRDKSCKENVNMVSTEVGLLNALTLDGKLSIEPNPFTVGDSIFRLLS